MEYHRIELAKGMQRSGATRRMLQGIVPGAAVQTAKSLADYASNEFSWAVVRELPKSIGYLLNNYGKENIQ